VRKRICILAALALTGCAPQMVYLRADGVPPMSDPVLNQQFEMDRTICNGDMQKANLSGVTFTGGGVPGVIAANNRTVAAGQVGQGCMAERGYVLVQQDQAAAKSQELAAIAAEKTRREAAAAAPPPPPPKQVAAKSKPKPPPQPSPPPALPVSQPSAN
jgi:hypothetical protein